MLKIFDFVIDNIQCYLNKTNCLQKIKKEYIKWGVFFIP